MIINTKPAGGAVLIETYWNVNDKWGDAWEYAAGCLNRNILECKYVNISVHMFVVCES